MAEKNWYIALELEYYPDPVTDNAIITATIDKKKNEWSVKARQNPSGIEKSYLDSEKQIRADMSDEDMKRKMIEEATSIFLEKMKNIAKTGGEIKKDLVIPKLSKQFPGIRKETIEKALLKEGVKFVDDKGGEDAAYKKYYERPSLEVTINGKVTDIAKTTPLQDKNLEIFGYKDLYEYLYPEENQSMVRHTPVKQLFDQASRMKEELNRKNSHDSKATAGGNLTQYCMSTAFVNEETKKCYDKYLAWKDREKFFKKISENHVNLAIPMNTDAFAGYVTELRDFLPSEATGQAEKIVEAYCREKGIAIPFSGEFHVKIVPKCLCGNELTGSDSKCLKCGNDVYVSCPKCGEKNINSNTICVKCGADFEHINQAIALCESADSCLRRMEFDVARMLLNQAKELYADYSKIQEIDSRLVKQENQIGSIVKEMEQACQKKEFLAAKDKLEQIHAILPSYQNRQLEEDIELGIKTAEEKKALAQKATDEVAIINACQAAYDACHDYPGIKEMIAKYPPVEATDLQVTCNAEKRINYLSWKPSSTKGQVYYVVVRKENAVPVSPTDGDEIGRVSMCEIEDETIEPGKKYFYAVFSERTGIYSSPLVSKDAIVNYFEIQGVQLTAGNESIKISWRKFASDATIQIERIENGKNVPLTCNNSSVFLDENLENEREYQYHVFLRYSAGMEVHNTTGVIVSGAPVCPPEPIDSLIVKSGENGIFRMTWENRENSSIRFFYSDEKPKFKLGDIISVSELEMTMKPLSLDHKEENRGDFVRQTEEAFFVMAAVIKGSQAVIGNLVRTCSTGNVNIRNVNLVNGKIFIDVDIPKNVDSFVVLYYHDHFPTDISDEKAKRYLVRKGMVEHHNGIEISPVEQKDYYFSIFACYKQDGEREYSAGTNYLFHNAEKQVIFYSLEVRKALFKKPVLVINFESEEEDFTLPDIDIMYEVGRAPVYKENSKLYCQIDQAKINGNRVSYQLELDDEIKKDTYMKAFLRTEGLAQSFQLKQQRGSSLQIL